MSQLLEPATPAEVADILRDAADRRVRVMPVGSGTEAPPAAAAEVVLSTRRLSGIEIYEPADLTFTAGAGTTLGTLDEALGANGQFLPFDPPGGPARTLGGVVATGWGGPLGSGYGFVRDQVLGITLVTGDGRILRLGGRVMKNVAGFDLVRLAVGSRGSLGVVVSASLRVFPRPAVDRLVVMEGDLETLLAAARAVRTTPRVPASAVLVRPEAGATARLVLRLQGSDPVVDADQAVFQAAVPGAVSAVAGGTSGRLVAATRDATLGSAVRVGLTALPGRLDDVLGAVPGVHAGSVPFLADVMSGAVTVGLEADSEEEEVRAVAKRTRELGGSAILLTGPPAWRAATAEDGPAAALADRVRRTFDPRGTLAAGGVP